MSNPTILIVPGSFAPPTLYATVVRLLKERGYPAVAIQLPSTTKRAPLEPASMLEDAATIKRAAEIPISLGRSVIVMAHSYGGLPTTQGLFSVPVKQIIYLAATVPKLGQSQADTMGELGVRDLGAVGGYMHLPALEMAGAMGHGMAWEDAYPLVNQMSHHSERSFLEGVTQLAYKLEGGKGVKVSYVLTERDLIIAPQVQRGFIKVLEEARGGDIDVVAMDTGHAPSSSCQEKLVEVLIEWVEK